MEKKVVVVADMGSLSDTDFATESDLKSQAMNDNPGIVPTISPTAAVVQSKAADMKKEMKDRDLLVSEAQQKTSNIEAMRKDLTNIFTSQWAFQIQDAVAGDEGKVEVLRFKVKGKTPAPPPEPDSMPLVSKIDINVAGQHTLYLINSITHKKALPSGILRIDIYGQSGGTLPANLAELIANGGGYLGQAVGGKYVNVFTDQKTGTVEYYIAVYVSSKTKNPFSYSKTARAVITM